MVRTTTVDDEVETRIKLTGATREDAAVTAVSGHEVAREVLARYDTLVAVRSIDEAEAVVELLDAVEDERGLTASQERAVERVRTELVEARGEFRLDALDEDEDVAADGGEATLREALDAGSEDDDDGHTTRSISERDHPEGATDVRSLDAITARGQYRDAIDAELDSDVATRRSGSYDLRSLAEAVELVEACDQVLDDGDVAGSTEGAVERVRGEAVEARDGLRALTESVTGDDPLADDVDDAGDDVETRLVTDGGRDVERPDEDVEVEALAEALRTGEKIAWNGRRERATVEYTDVSDRSATIKVETVRGATYVLRSSDGVREVPTVTYYVDDVTADGWGERRDREELDSIEVVEWGDEVDAPVDVGDIYHKPEVTIEAVEDGDDDLVLGDEYHEVVEVREHELDVVLVGGDGEERELGYVDLAERLSEDGATAWEPVDDLHAVPDDRRLPSTAVDEPQPDADGELPTFDEWVEARGGEVPEVLDDEDELVTDGGRDLGYEAAEHFAAYVSGVVELDATVTVSGYASITASEGAVRHAAHELGGRGYEVRLVEGEPPACLVIPDHDDLRAVVEAVEDGVPAPGEGLDVEDPVDRDEDVDVDRPDPDSYGHASSVAATLRDAEERDDVDRGDGPETDGGRDVDSGRVCHYCGETYEPTTTIERSYAEDDGEHDVCSTCLFDVITGGETIEPLPRFVDEDDEDDDELVTDGGRDDLDVETRPCPFCGRSWGLDGWVAHVRACSGRTGEDVSTDGGAFTDAGEAEFCSECSRYRLSCEHDESVDAAAEVDVSALDRLDMALGRLRLGVAAGATIERADEDRRLDVEVPAIEDVSDDLDLPGVDLMRDAGIERVARWEAVEEYLSGVLGETASGDVFDLRLRDGELNSVPVDVVSMPEGPDVDRDEWEPRADELVEETTLARREAEVRALKELGLAHGPIAEVLSIERSTVDEYSRRINTRIEDAEATLVALGVVEDDDELVTDGGRDAVEVTLHVSGDGRLFCWFDGSEPEDVEVELVEAAVFGTLPDEWLDRAEARLVREGLREDPAPRVATVSVVDGDTVVDLSLDADAVDAMTSTERDRERGRLVTDGGRDRGDEDLADRHERERTGVAGDPVPDRDYGDDPEDLVPDVDPDEVAGDGGDGVEVVDSTAAILRARDGRGTAYTVAAVDLAAHDALDAIGFHSSPRLYLVTTDGGDVLASAFDRYAVGRELGERWIVDELDRLDDALDGGRSE